MNKLSKIRDVLNLYEYNLEKTDDLREWHKTVGLIEALRNESNRQHGEVLKELKVKKAELEECKNDEILFEMQTQYLQGYIAGCIKILEINRENFKEQSDLRIIGFVEELAVRDIIAFLLKQIGFIESLTFLEGLSFWLSSDVEEINMIDENSEDVLRLIVVQSPKKSFPKRNMSKEEIELYKKLKKSANEVLNPNYITPNETLAKIKKLKMNYEKVIYVYIDSIISIESLLAQIYKQLKI